MHLRTIAFLILSILTSACGVGNISPPRVYKLPNGDEVKVIKVHKLVFPKGDPALVMDYETDLSIEDNLSLRHEVNQIWEVFRQEVEAANLKAGAIRAIEKNESGKGYGFVFTKQADGTWICLDDTTGKGN